ncbi:C45 family autoproteolytic acyltransferase/hydolase [Salmonirosea aquatica]|uniref:Acyl-CoA--6-aminopenicillanic acid acyltransferase n=1 Tax=Salmonirosea aquatica TaxID=2654236 RepID=A0A7C9BUD3_9BACT|nr:acyl-CoA--6-aminopenicillanic acid acyltransferase [Cytophagaceae bacterium SJW1-29]
MLHLDFNSISESILGPKWQKLFNTHWPAYRAWFQSKGAATNPDLHTSVAQLRHYMPEMMPTYERMCELAGHDPIAARFLTGWQPPAYISGCSQVVTQNPPQLVRNYDYHPNLSEGTLLHSAWNGKAVMATGDCLWGVVDGINADGLVASLTFGGRKVVGKGFGIPFILRYVLEFCSTVDEAVAALQRVPSHMAYNIMLLDKSGAHKMLQIAPDQAVVVTDALVSTNHQHKVDWPEHAQFSKTVERERYLLEMLATANLEAEDMAQTFLHPPLYARRFNEGFGTIYTAVYRPAEGYLELRWPGKTLRQSFDGFQEGITTVHYSESVQAIPVPATQMGTPAAATPAYVPTETDEYWTQYGQAWATGDPTVMAKNVAQSILSATGKADDAQLAKLLELFTSETKKRGQIPWEMLADLWDEPVAS